MLKRQPRGSARVWRDLIDGWGHGWSAEAEYLDALAAAASAEHGPILECGSGLTTLVLATIAQRTGSPIWTLEHDPDWLRVAERGLRRFGLDANVRLTPLRDYGDFDWYDVAPTDVPTFGLVICDGPPNWTRGGRYGLLPVLGERLAPGCTILLEDAGRPGERETLRRWQSEGMIGYEIRGEERRFALARVPTAARGRNVRAVAGSRAQSDRRLNRPERRPRADRQPHRRASRKYAAAAVLAAGAILFSIFGLLPEALGDRPYNAFGKDSRAHHGAAAKRS